LHPGIERVSGELGQRVPQRRDHVPAHHADSPLQRGPADDAAEGGLDDVEQQRDAGSRALQLPVGRQKRGVGLQHHLVALRLLEPQLELAEQSVGIRGQRVGLRRERVHQADQLIPCGRVRRWAGLTAPGLARVQDARDEPLQQAVGGQRLNRGPVHHRLDVAIDRYREAFGQDRASAHPVVLVPLGLVCLHPG
ncbi:MAG: hypothetical protein AN487_22930, partial [Anabaena sp. CRKS33]